MFHSSFKYLQISHPSGKKPKNDSFNMWLPEGSPVTVAPWLLHNLLIYADKFLLYLSKRYKPFNAFRYLLLSSFFLLLRFIPSFLFDSLNSLHNTLTLPSKTKNDAVSVSEGDSGIARALSQLLSIVTEIPVSSRKYEVVRSLAERIIEENHQEGSELLNELNRSVLKSAFGRTMRRLEEAVVVDRGGPGEWGLNRVMWAVRSRVDRWEVVSAEKLGAELVWLAKKMVACGSGDEAVRLWAAAANLAWLAITADPRLQGSLVKVTALLFMEAKGMGLEATEEVMKTETHKATKLKMLQTWLPFLCRASNGTDAPVLSLNERSELEKVLEESIEELEDEQEQEQVLFLWLHHFTHPSSSDWPNLHGCYARWCSASRRQLMLLQ